MFALQHHSIARSVWPRFRAYRALILIALVWLADWLFYGHVPGLSLAVFICFLSLAVVLMASHRTPVPNRSLALATLAAALVPSLQVVNPLSLVFALTGLIVFTLLINRRFGGDMLARLNLARVFVTAWPMRLLIDLVRLLKGKGAAGAKSFMPAAGPGWFLPVTCSLIFVGLFASANPLIEAWLSKLDLISFLGDADPLRWGFWAAALVLCWPFLRVRTWLPTPEPALAVDAAEPGHAGRRLDVFFSELAVFRSLLLFNAIFALQNGLDATFLWGGAALPEGMTYAAYAHRGAYTLIVTALLAAAFVLFAARRGAPSEHSARVRWLLLLWTAQNALLVQYCVLRLNLYVEAYALTYWRVAAFAWMALVFGGLVLIFAKFIWSKSAAWLIKSNLICLTIVLYAAGNTNLPALIANHNVQLHAADKIRVIDPVYLASLGPAALPAIDQVLANLERYGFASSRAIHTSAAFQLGRARTRLARQVALQAADWRAWGWRHARTKAYLARLQAPHRMAPWQLENP